MQSNDDPKDNPKDEPGDRRERDTRHDDAHGERAAQAAQAAGPTGQPQPQPTEATKQANPPRSNVHPEQTAEVPYGTGTHAEPPGGGGRPSQRRKPGETRKP